MIDWTEFWAPSTHLPGMLLKAIVIYVMLCILLRVAPKRQVGTLTPNEVLLVVMIGGLAIRTISEGAKSIADVAAIAGTLVGCSVGANWLAFRFPKLKPWLQEPPTRLVRDGRILRNNMRHEMITEDELMAHLRRAGIEDLAKVQEAYLEVNGEISVLQRPGAAAH